MSRVDLLGAEDAPLLARPYYAEGDPGPIVAALAQVPELLHATLAFVSATLGPSSIDGRTKELVILRTSAVSLCRYCVDSHSVVALDTGVNHDEVVALRAVEPVWAEIFADPREVALLQWVDAVAAGRGPVADSAAARMKAEFADHEVVELTLLIAATLMLNRFCTALELPTAPAVADRLRGEHLR